jgi:glutamyl-tRNA reductase
MNLVLAGISHKTAPVEIRERLAIPEARIPEALAWLLGAEGVSEALILSTCNRVEVLLATAPDYHAVPILEQFFLESGLPALEPALYRREGRDAIHHLFRVASSLDSMIVGEPQILGQLKSAYALAKDQGAVNSVLERVTARAFAVAKRVRSETGIGQMAVSVSYAAVELAKKIFGTLNGRKVMIVGAGKMSELSARHLHRGGAAHIFVTNRTYERAVEMAEAFGGTPIEHTRFLSFLPEIDILIASSAAPHYILHRHEVQHVITARRNRPMFLIDIAVPRNIDPEVNRVDNAFLYDIDDLQGVVNANREERHKEAVRAEEIIAVEVDRMIEMLKVREVAPTIVSLQEQLEAIRAGEIERARRKLGTLTPQQDEVIQAMTRAIVNKIAHGPISELRRRAADPDGVHVIDAIRKVFHLK